MKTIILLLDIFIWRSSSFTMLFCVVITLIYLIFFSVISFTTILHIPRVLSEQFLPLQSDYFYSEILIFFACLANTYLHIYCNFIFIITSPRPALYVFKLYFVELILPGYNPQDNLNQD